jgi:MurNAc alpha-1-phosphate uridylyltransferase
MQASRVTGEHYRGKWLDIGTPERLSALEVALGSVGT